MSRNNFTGRETTPRNRACQGRKTLMVQTRSEDENAHLPEKALVILLFLGSLLALFDEGRLTSGICGIDDSLRLRQ